MFLEPSGFAPLKRGRPFHHQALLYAGTKDFVAQATPLVQSALGAGQPVLAALTPANLAGLQANLGQGAERVRWLDVTGIGRNPACIIPLWREFVDRYHQDRLDRPLLGLGEPIYAGRTPPEMVEAVHHEGLLNIAFAGCSDFDLYCPYDTHTLNRRVVESALVTHPHLSDGSEPQPSADYRRTEAGKRLPVLCPAAPEDSLKITLRDIPVANVYRFVVDHALRLGVGEAARDALALATAAASTAIRGETLSLWSDPELVLTEVRGSVTISNPLAGREWPAPRGEPQHGLWLANQLCDLVQWRSDGAGSIIRMQRRRVLAPNDAADILSLFPGR